MDEKKFYNLDLTCAEYNGKWGFVNNEGEFVIPPRFDRETEFINECVAPVCVNGKWGLINAAGTYILTPEYDNPDDLLDDIDEIGLFSYIMHKDIGRSIYDSLELEDDEKVE